MKKETFAKGFNFYKLFWIFFIGCFLGVVIETIWCLVTRFKFESRSGLIYGPFNLVYGFGAVFITVALYWLRNKRDLWIFLGGTILGGAFEYLCSYVQQAMFSTVSWEYSNMPFNLHGRINLTYSFFWGILALLWVKEVYPRVSNLIEKIPAKIGKPLTYILLLFMIFNSAISAMAVNRQVERRNNIEATSSVDVFLDKHYPDELLKKVYANMIFK